ncbi:MAG: methyl-accepting chemotaxis protein [Mycobacterium leprae]
MHFRSLGARLALGFGSVLLLGALIIGVVFFQTLQVSQDYASTIAGRTQNINLAGQLTDALQRQNSAVVTYLVSGDATDYAAVTNGENNVKEAMATVKSHIETQESQVLWNQLVSAQSDVARMQNEMLSAWRNQAKDRALNLLVQSRGPAQQLSDTAEQFRQLQIKDAQADADRLAAQTRNMLIVIVGLGLISIVLGLFFAIRTTRSIVRPIRMVAAAASSLAAGDLTSTDLPVQGKDEIGEMARSVSAALTQLRYTLARVLHSADQVAANAQQLETTAAVASESSREIALSVSQIAERAHGQMGSSDVVAGAMTELQQAVSQVAAGSQQQAQGVQDSAASVNRVQGEMDAVTAGVTMVAGASARASEAVESGSQVVNRTLEAMRLLQGAVDQASVQVKTLVDSSHRIGEITAVITEIADQTNLLALNAAIEAARAGDAGRGFAVVADEVRKLAERSSRSAGEIGQLISDMQQGTGRVTKAMEAGRAQADAGSKLAESAGRALGQIREAVAVTHKGMQEISDSVAKASESSRQMAAAMNEMAAVTEQSSAATEEMAGGVEQVLGSMDEVAGGARDTAAAAEQVSASVEEASAASEEIAEAAATLAKVAAGLQELVRQFNLGSVDLAPAVAETADPAAEVEEAVAETAEEAAELPVVAEAAPLAAVEETEEASTEESAQ